MKKSMRIAAGLIAGLLALTPCVVTSLTAEATSITIKGAGTGDAEHEYAAYQIITGELTEKDGKQVLSKMEWGTGVDSAALIAALTANATDLGITMPAETTVENIADALSAITGDAAKVEKLAKIFNETGILKGTPAEIEPDGSNYKATLPADGWYFIKDNLTPADGNAVSANLLQVIGDVTVNPKYSLPSLEKKILEGEDEKDANTASIGDTVTYKLTTKVPVMTGYDKYFFNISDTLSKGLTYVPDSVKVTVGGTEITADADNDPQTVEAGMHYYATDAAATDGTGTSIKFVFQNFVNEFKGAEGQEIVVTYDAVLNNDAVIDGAGNPNTASLTYSNNPNSEGEGEPTKPDEPGSTTPTGKTPDETVKTFTTEIVIDKIDKDTKDKLDGIKFRLTGTGLQSVLTEKGLYVKDDSVTGENAYYLLKDGSFTNDAPTGDADHDKDYESTTQKYAFTTASSVSENAVYVDTEGVTADGGQLKFSGLNAGTYTITEIETLEGYNLLTSPITVTIGEGTIAADLSKCTFTYEPDDMMDGNIITIENSQGSTLPSTGGIGTKLFYMIGGMLVVGSGVLLVTKKRMSKIEK